jgi:membrane-bound lytic murein transglycosylase F
MPRSRDNTRIAVALAFALQLAGTWALLQLLAQPATPLLERVRESGVLTVATRHSPSVYFTGASGPNGFDYALVERFAETLQVEVRYVFPQSIEALLDATVRGEVHLAAAGLTVTEARQQRVNFSVPYHAVTEQLIYRRGDRRPRSMDEIAPGDLHVVAGSSHEETLRLIQRTGGGELLWEPHPVSGAADLLAGVDRGELRLTVADSTEVVLNRRVFAHTAVAFDLGEPRPIAWAFSRVGDDSLRKAANRFLLSLENNGELRRLRAEFFGHSGRMNFVDTREFWRHVRDRLPALRPHFEEAAEQTGIDWRLLAAIGYQESHWRSDAVSPTGVRGVMMLTRPTADRVGVDDRHDARQSILGGARYLRIIEGKIPERIMEPNRLWLTLAGYNVGFGHLEDARVLTERDGGNPDLWIDVKERLPLLSKKKYYSTLRHGYARGREPVDYVDNIRNYYDLLIWYSTTGDHRTRERLLAADADVTADGQ